MTWSHSQLQAPQHSRLHAARKELLLVVASLTVLRPRRLNRSTAPACTRTPTKRPMAAPVKSEGTKSPMRIQAVATFSSCCYSFQEKRVNSLQKVAWLGSGMQVFSSHFEKQVFNACLFMLGFSWCTGDRPIDVLDLFWFCWHAQMLISRHQCSIATSRTRYSKCQDGPWKQKKKRILKIWANRVCLKL